MGEINEALEKVRSHIIERRMVEGATSKEDIDGKLLVIDKILAETSV